MSYVIRSGHKLFRSDRIQLNNVVICYFMSKIYRRLKIVFEWMRLYRDCDFKRYYKETIIIWILDSGKLICRETNGDSDVGDIGMLMT